MCVCVFPCKYMLHAIRCPRQAKRGCQKPGNRIHRCCEPSRRRAGTELLWKSNRCFLTAEPPLQPSCFYSYLRLGLTVLCSQGCHWTHNPLASISECWDYRCMTCIIIWINADPPSSALYCGRQRSLRHTLNYWCEMKYIAFPNHMHFLRTDWCGCHTCNPSIWEVETGRLQIQG